MDPKKLKKFNVKVIDRLQVALNELHWAWSVRNNATKKSRTKKSKAAFSDACVALSGLIVKLHKNELAVVEVDPKQVN